MSRHILTLLISISLVFCSCGGQGSSTPVKGEVLLSLPMSNVGPDASQQFIKVTAHASWTLELGFSGSERWASVDTEFGRGTTPGIILSWDENTTESDRTCNIVLFCDGTRPERTLTQVKKQASVVPPTPPSGPDDLVPDPVPSWLELPATDNNDLYFFTHDMMRGSKKVRNYSFYYDPEARMSAWVAYPLNQDLIGSGSRSDEWGLDPKIPAKYQQTLYNGYSGGYQRGHQIPSADRYGSGINEQTFYFINSTPQRGELNEKAWAKLEGYVRNWSKRLDTLYVVTGADFRNSTQYAYDNQGSSVPVPTAYYKALLAYKKGGSIANSTGGYMGIAFWFEHRSYADAAIMSTQFMSIDALEQKLGVDFFANLPAKLGADVANKIEASEDKSWWDNNK